MTIWEPKIYMSKKCQNLGNVSILEKHASFPCPSPSSCWLQRNVTKTVSDIQVLSDENQEYPRYYVYWQHI